jgi:hypothetical protein
MSRWNIYCHDRFRCVRGMSIGNDESIYRSIIVLIVYTWNIRKHYIIISDVMFCMCSWSVSVITRSVSVCSMFSWIQ